MANLFMYSVRKKTVITGLLFFNIILSSKNSSHASEAIECSNIHNDTSIVTLDIRVLKTKPTFKASIPRTYFDPHNIPNTNTTQDSVLLNLDVLTQKPWPEDMRRHPDTGTYGRLLVSDFVDLKTLAQRNAKINSGISISSTKKIQTQHYQYGLEKYNYQPLKNSGAFYAEVFKASNPAGNISDVIICDIPQERKQALCTHFMDSSLADLKITYARRFLPKWKNISTGSAGLWACMTSLNND